MFSAHLTNYAEGGLPSAQHAAYYAARARGGVGLIITEEHSTHPTDWPYEKLIHGFNPSVLDGYRRITDAVHAYGTPILAQLNHNGGQGSSMYSRLAVWAPSAVPDPLFREVPKAVDHRELAEIVDGYAEVAARCVEGGFDGVELQCSHSSIVRAFLSGATNRRVDEWGGTLANRARLLLTLVARVREAIGPRAALGVRLCGDELLEERHDDRRGGRGRRDGRGTGAVDYLNTSIGVATSSLFAIEASMAVRPGYALYIPSAIRRRVGIPVIGVGRFKDPLQADRALRRGALRPRRRRPRPDRRPRLRAQGALRARRVDPPVPLVQPGVRGPDGPEPLARLHREPRTPAARRVEAPWRRRRGADASLSWVLDPPACRPASPLRGEGTTSSCSSASPSRAARWHWPRASRSRSEFGDLVRNLLTELASDAGRRARRSAPTLDASAARPRRRRSSPRGPRPATPWWAHAVPDGAPQLLDVTDVLRGRRGGGDGSSSSTSWASTRRPRSAELLADRGHTVEIASPALVVGQDLGVTLDLEQFWVRATAKGSSRRPRRWSPGSSRAPWPPSTCSLAPSAAATSTRVVLALPPLPHDALAADVRDGGLEVHVIGDARAPRRAHAAVLDGDRVGSAL